MKLKAYTEAELDEQKRVIDQIMETGTPEQVETLYGMMKDPEVHPQIRDMLITRLAVISIMDACGGEVEIAESKLDGLPKKPEDTIDLKVARLGAQSVLGKKIWLEIDREIQKSIRREKEGKDKRKKAERKK